MLVSTSFLSSKDIPNDLRKLNKTDTDFIHVDVMDGKFVKNKSLPFSEMKNIYKFTDKRLDVHLMVDKPSRVIEDYASLNCEYITIHLEVDEDIEKVLSSIFVILSDRTTFVSLVHSLKTEEPICVTLFGILILFRASQL